VEGEDSVEGKAWEIIQALAKSTDLVREYVGGLTARYNTALAENARLTAEAVIWKSSLECWGRHHPWCWLVTQAGVEGAYCNCGYKEALTGKDRSHQAAPMSPHEEEQVRRFEARVAANGRLPTHAPEAMPPEPKCLTCGLYCGHEMVPEIRCKCVFPVVMPRVGKAPPAPEADQKRLDREGELTLPEVRELLRAAVSQHDSARAAALRWKLSAPYLCEVMNGTRDPGPKILRLLGLEKRTTVRYAHV
jgi:hypothetical protein